MRAPARAVMCALLAGASVLGLSAPAQAQVGGAEARADQERITYAIEAQPLADALAEFARQSGLSFLFSRDRLAGAHAPALRGAFTREEALDRLLAGSGFEGHVEGQSIRLTERANPQRASAGADPEPTAAPARPGEDAAAAQPDVVAGDEEIVVTGTRIRGAAPAGSHVITLDREQIDQTGRSTVQEVLQTLPQNFGGSQNEFTQEGTQNARSNFSYASTVDLRGLGADATLTLVDGHRLAPAGLGGYIDISTIPLSAVERVEVLADGASAAYGADAVAGVVNLILRDDFEGAETGVRFGATSQGGASERAFSQLLGASWGSGQIMGAYEYRARGELDILDRPFLATADFTDRGGTDFRGTRSNPGNIIRIGTTTVSLPIPAGQDGTSLSQSDLVTGPLNRNEINEGAFFLPRQETHSFFIRGRQELTPSLEFYGHAIGAERDVYLEREQLFANLVVPESNYYRQANSLFLGQGNITVAYYLGDDLGPVINRAEVRAWSSVVGLRYDIGETDWVIDGSLASAHSQEAIFNENFYNSLAASPALASGNIATAFNPFGDGSNTPASVLAGLTFDIETHNDAETIVAQVQADGPLFRIWGGDVRLALGVERREERFEVERREIYPSGPVQQFIQDPGERSIDALFGEVHVPLISADNNVPLVHALTLSASVRHEDASDYGESTTPRFGVRWALTPDLSLRASWGQSFKGPQFSQMLGDIVLSYTTVTAAQDPLADNGSTGILSVAGSNGGLRPETAENWTAGFDYSPSWADGLNLHATYFDIDFSDRIFSAGNVLSILANPAGYESILFRDPSPALIAQYLALGAPPSGSLPADGVELIIDRRLVNLSSQRIRGVDLSADMTLDSDWGAFDLFINASGMLEFEQVLIPGAAPVDMRNTVNGVIDWRFRAGLAYRLDDWAAVITANYANGYRDTLSLPNREVDSQTTWDLRLARTWREQGNDGPGFQASLNVINALDEDPPFVNNPTGYAFDASNASPLGRIISLELRQRW
ncbi:MAG: TonB-dependent receptor [Alphaproteobacteria bacterium]|nr:MAG: TonB-dependent receptor [Alphaproteobacteria bacterium]